MIKKRFFTSCAANASAHFFLHSLLLIFLPLNARYRVIQKKLFKGHFRLIQTALSKKIFCNGILGQRTVQIFKIFGPHQNHENSTMTMPYLPEKCRFGINFFAKRITILLLYMYQVFIFLQDHLHFFLHFFFTFMEQFFLDDPIYTFLCKTIILKKYHSIKKLKICIFL